MSVVLQPARLLPLRSTAPRNPIPSLGEFLGRQSQYAGPESPVSSRGSPISSGGVSVPPGGSPVSPRLCPFAQHLSVAHLFPLLPSESPSQPWPSLSWTRAEKRLFLAPDRSSSCAATAQSSAPQRRVLPPGEPEEGEEGGSRGPGTPVPGPSSLPGRRPRPQMSCPPASSLSVLIPGGGLVAELQRLQSGTGK